METIVRRKKMKLMMQRNKEVVEEIKYQDQRMETEQTPEKTIFFNVALNTPFHFVCSLLYSQWEQLNVSLLQKKK